MKSFLLLPLALIALTGTAHATSYYVSDCGAGAKSQCVAGADANAGTSPSAPWKSCDKVSERFPSLAMGDQVLFARGSAQTACKLYYLSNLKSRATNPIVLGAYTPLWAPVGAGAPILNGTDATFTLGLMNSGNSSHDEGYIVQDLRFVGTGVNSKTAAIIMSNDVKNVTIQRVEVEQSRHGVQCNGGTGNPLAIGSDGLTEHITIRNTNIHHNRGIGILSGCSDTLIENSTFDNNGVGMFDHHIYLTSAAVGTVQKTVKQVVIRGNTLTNNAPYASDTAALPTPGLCGAVAIVVHGLQDGVVIENNTISEPTVPSNGACWGISVDTGGYGHAEGFTNLTIRGNTVVNYAIGIGVDMCSTCTIENNSVYSARPASSGIVAPSKYFQAAIAGNTLNNNLSVRNNTVYLKTPNYSSVGVRVSRDGSSHTIASNLVYFGSGSTSATACFNTSGLPTGSFKAFDYNLCYYSATAGKWDATRGSLAMQQLAGLDSHSTAVNPLLATPVAPSFVGVVAGNSTALRKGHPMLSSKLSLGGLRRDVVSDIGAQQYGATVVVPSSATGMSIQ